MTLVLAINLSDRLYLAADTQVTQRKTDGTSIRGHDMQLKCEVLSAHLMVGCAGNAKMAAFLVREVLKTGVCNLGIRDFEIELKKILPRIVGEFLLQGASYNESYAILTFAGMDFGKHKIIDVKKYITLAKRFQDVKKQRIDSTFQKKPLQAFTQDELSIFWIMARNSQMGMKDIILRGLKKYGVKEGKIEIPITDGHVFQVRIDCAAKDEKILFEDYAWGDWAVSGAVVPKEIPEELMLNLDFSMAGGSFEKDNYNLSIAITSNFSKYIGGCVTSFLINPEGIFTITQSFMRRRVDSQQTEILYEVALINGRIHKKTSQGIFLPLLTLTQIADEATYEL